jgi:tetratricopeptide (TPR) repeat protein
VDYLGRALEYTAADQVEQRCAILLERAKVFDLQGEREQELHDIQQLDELANRLGDPLYQAESALRQASIAEITGGYMSSAGHAQRAIRLGEEAQITRCVAEGYLRWGIVLMRQNELPVARTQLEHALSLSRQSGLTRLESDSLRNLGIVNRMMAQYKEAREYHELSLQMSRRTGDRRGESHALSSLGVVASDLTEYAEAIHYFELPEHPQLRQGGGLHPASPLDL